MTRGVSAPDPRPDDSAATVATARPVPILQRLGTRFALVLAMALVPIGTVSLYMTAQVQDQFRARTETSLMGETLRAASPEIGLIQQTRGLVAGLAGALRSPMPLADCQALLSAAEQTIMKASLVVYVPRSGMMTCSSTGKSHDFTDNPLFQRLRDSQAPSLVTIRQAPISETAVLAISHPVLDPQGVYQGYVSVSLPQSGLEQLSRSFPTSFGVQESTVRFLTFDRQGEILTASAGVDLADFQRPNDRSLASLVGQPSSVFRADSQTGLRRSFAVVPLAEGQLYLLGSWAARGDEQTPLAKLSPYLPAVLMILVGLIAAGWASERLVTRHIRVLNRSITRFAAGDRHLRENLVRGAPAELMALGQAFAEMSENIIRGEAELEDIIHQREVLLRELHHRLKNNLQLIASIMNMQRRRITSPEARHIIKRLQDRIVSLATVHRGLYQTSGLVDVRADEFFGDLVQQIFRLTTQPGSQVSIETDFAPLLLAPDQAIPLALFLTEAIGNAVQFVGAPANGKALIRVSLTAHGDDEAILQIANTLPPDSAPSPLPDGDAESEVGLGRRLMTTFARQIGGTLQSGLVQGDFCDTLRFTPRQISGAQDRAKFERAA